MKLRYGWLAIIVSLSIGGYFAGIQGNETAIIMLSTVIIVLGTTALGIKIANVINDHFNT